MRKQASKLLYRGDRKTEVTTKESAPGAIDPVSIERSPYDVAFAAPYIEEIICVKMMPADNSAIDIKYGGDVDYYD